MRNSLVLLILALCLSTLPCSARLGETLDQCIARFGQPEVTKDADDSPGSKEKDTTFKKKGFEIDIVFLDGKSVSESYWKIDGSDLSESEKATLLEANSANHTWTRSAQTVFSDFWLRDDKEAIASYKTFAYRLTVSSIDYFMKLKAKSYSDEKNELKNF